MDAQTYHILPHARLPTLQCMHPFHSIMGCIHCFLGFAMQQDAILKVTSTAICGSDLHMYTGAMPGMTKGDLLGHEV